MSELETMGISVQRGFVKDEDTEATQLGFTLPKPIELQATFVKEVFKHKLVKIFTTEIQAGDSEFDPVVYVKTDTPELTAKLLENADVRAAIARICDGGGLIEVDGPFVQMEIPGHHDEDTAETITLVRALTG